MFGNNPQRPLEHNLNGRALRINSIFATIQGEGPFAGQPCVFIRTAGCNLACHFCDTEFEKGWEHPQTIEHIIKNVSTACAENQELRRLVVITGGEPLIQNLAPLIEALLESGTDIVQIETAGTAWSDSMQHLMESAYGASVTLVCSPKTPKVHPGVAAWCEHYKYIITAGEVSPEDGLPVYSTQKKGEQQRLFRPENPDLANIFVQPCDAHDPVRNMANKKAAVWSAMKFNYVISVQAHKMLDIE